MVFYNCIYILLIFVVNVWFHCKYCKLSAYIHSYFSKIRHWRYFMILKLVKLHYFVWNRFFKLLQISLKMWIIVYYSFVFPHFLIFLRRPFTQTAFSYGQALNRIEYIYVDFSLKIEFIPKNIIQYKTWSQWVSTFTNRPLYWTAIFISQALPGVLIDPVKNYKLQMREYYVFLRMM